MKVSEMALECRPRERLEQFGTEALSNAELLAVLLKSGTKKANVLQMSHKLLAKYGLKQLANCSVQELCTEHGIGKAKACQITALFELYRRVPNNKESEYINCAEDVVNRYMIKMENLRKEHVIAIYLDTKNKIICDETITVGILNQSLVHPREVFHGAIKHLANSVIVVHNHPSGDPTPSKDDLEVTEKLKEAGETLGIKLIDHLIIGKKRWWSWKEDKNI